MATLIGITSSFEEERHHLSHHYVRSVENAGGVPVLLPAAEREATVRELVTKLDGLIITGGPAITMGLIGELPDDLARTDPQRARFDEQITRAFLDSDKPILGICYGMQLLNALDGGKIFADVERQLDGALAHSTKRGGNGHYITIRQSTHLFDILGAPAALVNTRHIQAVAEVGPSFRVAADAPDGVIEAIESTDGRVLGVQFHPERMNFPSIFTNLVNRCDRG